MRMTPKLFETAPPVFREPKDWPPVDVTFSHRRGRVQMKLTRKTDKVEFATPADAIHFARQLWRAAILARKGEA